MYIMPISKINDSKTTFNGSFKPIDKLLKPKNIEEQINKLSTNEDAKDIFKGLSLLAASLAAEIALFVQQNENAKTIINGLLNDINSGDNTSLNARLNTLFNENTSEKEKLQTFDINKLTEEKPERTLYLKITSYFPNLDTQYKQMLQKYALKPDDEKNKFVLSSFENILKMFSSSNEKLMSMKPYLDALNNKYSNCLDGIAENLSSTVANGHSVMSYMVLLHNEKLSENDIYRWAKCKNLDLDEFLITLSLSDEAAERLSQLKETNNHFKIKKCQAFEDERYNIPTYAFKLEFSPDNLSAAKKLNTVAKVHEAIYGNIHLKENKDTSSNFLVEDIQNELIDNILKDRRLDATYNFVKYIKPSALQEFNYTADEIKFLEKESKDYNKIKSICSHVIMNLDTSNPKIEKFCEVLSNDKMFGKVFTNRHAKLRFVTRFVLKDNPNADLVKDTTEKLNIFYSELKNRLDHCNFYCYMHTKGTAPQLYLGQSELGNFIKITLNNEGSIHTIYEDFNKELKQRSFENGDDE